MFLTASVLSMNCTQGSKISVADNRILCTAYSPKNLGEQITNKCSKRFENSWFRNKWPGTETQKVRAQAEGVNKFSFAPSQKSANETGGRREVCPTQRILSWRSLRFHHWYRFDRFGRDFLSFQIGRTTFSFFDFVILFAHNFALLCSRNPLA